MPGAASNFLLLLAMPLLLLNGQMHPNAMNIIEEHE